MPTNALNVQSVSPAGAAYQVGNTIYYRGAAAGNLQLLNAVNDAGSAPASSIFPALGGTLGTWTHTTQTVNTPAGGPYLTTNNFAWNAGETNSPTESVTSTDNAGNTSNATVLTFTNDSTAPSVTTPTVGAGYYTSLSVPVTLNGGSDGGSGLASGSSVVQRDDATLSGGSCGSFSGSWTTITLSAGNDTSVQNGKCYEYREQLTDNVGNVGSSSASAIAKVDNTGPSNALTLTSISPAGSVLKSGNTIYYRGSQTGGGSFKIRNAVSDPESGAASSQTAALGGSSTGWTHTPSIVATPAGGPFDSNDFAWSQGTTSAPTEVVTGRDGAANATASATLTLANDSNDPTGGALTVNGTAASGGGSGSYDSDGNFTIGTRTDYSETQISDRVRPRLLHARAHQRLLHRPTSAAPSAPRPRSSATPPKTGSPPAATATPSPAPTTSATPPRSQTTVKVDTTDPSAPALTISALERRRLLPRLGTTVYFKPGAAGGTSPSPPSSQPTRHRHRLLQLPAVVARQHGPGAATARRRLHLHRTATTNGTAPSPPRTTPAYRRARASTAADASAPDRRRLHRERHRGHRRRLAATSPTARPRRSAAAPTTARRRAPPSPASPPRRSPSSGDAAPATAAAATAHRPRSPAPPAQTVASGNCYLLTLTGTDNVGNATSLTHHRQGRHHRAERPDRRRRPSSAPTNAYWPGARHHQSTSSHGAAGGFTVDRERLDRRRHRRRLLHLRRSSAATAGATRGGAYTFTAASPTAHGTVTATNGAGARRARASPPSRLDAPRPAARSRANGTAATGGGSSSYLTSGTTLTIDSRTDYSETQSATESGLASSTLDDPDRHPHAATAAAATAHRRRSPAPPARPSPPATATCSRSPAPTTSATPSRSPPRSRSTPTLRPFP